MNSIIWFNNNLFYIYFTALITVICLKDVLVQAQRPAFGACPEHPTLNDFNVEKFQGRWYEIERSFYVFEIVANCASFNFSLNDDGTLDVKFSMQNRLTGNLNTYDGRALPQYLHNPAIMDYRADTRFPTAMARILPGSGRYYIISTDYTTYAIMWSCSNMRLLHTDLVWILGREQDLTPEKRLEVYSILNDLDIGHDRLVLTKQENCPKQ